MDIKDEASKLISILNAKYKSDIDFVLACENYRNDMKLYNAICSNELYLMRRRNVKGYTG